MKLKIYITACLVLLFTAKGIAQCTFALAAETKPALCDNNGAIQALITYPSGSSEADFTGFTYHLEQGGSPVTSTSNTDSYIGGLAPGTYDLVVKGLCSSSGEVIQKVTGISITSNTVAPFKATYTGYGTHSLKDYPTGSLKFNISPAAAGTISSKFTVTITNHPVAYTGPKKFIVKSGDIEIGKLIRGNAGESYTFVFSDGCNDDIILSSYNVRQIDANFPDPTALDFSIQSARELTPGDNNKAWAAADLDKVLFEAKTNANFTAASFSLRWYDVGYSYTNDPATAEWRGLNISPRDPFIPRHPSYKYKDYIANGNGSTLGTPYIWLRLKDWPHATQAYQAKVKVSDNRISGFTIHQYLAGASIPLDFVSFNTGLSHYWLYSDLTLKATLNSNPAISYEATYTASSQVVPTLFVPWIPPLIENRMYKLELIMGSGDNQMVINLGDLDISPGINRSTTLHTSDSERACIDWEKVAFFVMNATTGNPLPGVGTISYNRDGWEYHTTTTGVFPHQTIKVDQEKLGNRTSIYLTANDEYGVDGTLKDIPSGTYRWSVIANPLDADSFGEPIKTANASTNYTKPDNPVIQQPYRSKLTSLKKVSQSCQDYTFSFNLSEITSRFTKKGGAQWPKDKILIVAYYYDNQKDSWNELTASNGIKFDDSNAARLIASAASPVVKFTVNKDWPLDRTKNVYLAAFAFQTSSINTSILQRVITEGGCYWMDSDPIIVDMNSLTRVVIDNDRTGGYRCTTGGAATLEVAMAVPADYKATLYKLGESNAFTEKTVTNTDVCVFTGLPADVNSYTVKVENVSTGNTCAIQNTSTEVYIQTLDNPRLAGYEGGLDCITNTKSDLILKVASIIKTSYQWIDPDGQVITFVNSGAKTYPGGAQVGAGADASYNVISIPAANIKKGQYRCRVTMDASTGCGPVEARTPYVSLDGGVPLYWSINAKDADWNNDENWNDALGSTAYRIPNKCSDVYIPAKVNTFFPNLDPTVTNGDARCRDINFQFGGQVAFTNLLNYDRAFVEYNFAYYGDGVNPTEGQLPTINRYNGVSPYGTISGAPSLSRNRWWMLSTPLKEMYTGDFELMGKPFSTRAGLKKIPDAVNNFSFANTANFGVLGDNNIPLSTTNNALMLWVPAYTGATGGSQDILQNAEIKGVLRYPYFDYNAIKTAREIPHSDLTTTFKVYDLLNPATQVASNDVTRTYYNVSKKIYQANRFVYEKPNGSIETDPSGEPVYKLQIPADAERSDGLVMVGNPFMSPLDLYNFYQANSGKIDPNFWILENGTWTAYNATPGSVKIAAQQAFAVKLSSPVGATELEFTLKDVIAPPNPSVVPKASIAEISKQMKQGSGFLGQILYLPETLVRFYVYGAGLGYSNTTSFITASWEDNNPGTESAVGEFIFVPGEDRDQRAIIYGSSPVYNYPVSVVSEGSNATLVFDYLSPKVKALTLTDSETGKVYNLFEYKNKNGIISIDVESDGQRENRYQLEITREK